jgi:hypothetical protein
LDPNIKREWYTQEEERRLTRLFWIDGKTYVEINNVLGNHGRGSIRQCLCYAARKGLTRLIKYLNSEKTFPRIEIDNVIRQYLISAACSETTVRWSEYRYSYALFYYFMYNEREALQRIPLELARILYERLSSRAFKRFK